MTSSASPSPPCKELHPKLVFNTISMGESPSILIESKIGNRYFVKSTPDESRIYLEQAHTHDSRLISNADLGTGFIPTHIEIPKPRSLAKIFRELRFVKLSLFLTLYKVRNIPWPDKSLALVEAEKDPKWVEMIRLFDSRHIK